MARHGVVITGAGQAGFQAAIALRMEGFRDPILLINGEPSLPYNRPPLSKGFLSGKEDGANLPFRPSDFYEEHGIRLLNDESVAELLTGTQQVRLASGAHLIPYDWLILATGARVRTLPNAPPGTCYLRTWEDATHLRTRLEDSATVATIGAGFIGLEAAAIAASQGKQVTVIAAEPRPMSRVVSPPISEYFTDLHQSHGVRLMLDASVGRIEPGYTIHLRSGESLQADLVVAGIGVVPNTTLASAAGLEVTDGIAVDQYLRTSNPNIFAIGDCACHPNRFSPEQPCRLESVQNAVDQARCVASTIAGTSKMYTSVPWFWTDQYDQKLQVAGLPALATSFVIRGNLSDRKFSVFGFRDGRLQSVESVNRPADHMLARKLLDTKQHQVIPSLAADSAFDLKSLLS